jgi:hypothetical protein
MAADPMEEEKRKRIRDQIEKKYEMIAQKHMTAQSEREKAWLTLTEAIKSGDKFRIGSAEAILKRTLSDELIVEKERAQVDEERVEQRHLFARLE